MTEKICPIMSVPMYNSKNHDVPLMIMDCKKDKCQRWWKCRVPDKPKGTMDVYCRNCEHSEGIIGHGCKKYKCGLVFVRGDRIKCDECIGDILRKVIDKGRGA